MRQAQNTSNGYSASGGAAAFPSNGQAAFASSHTASGAEPDTGSASNQRINGLREALASIEQRIGGMAQGVAAPPQQPPVFQPHPPAAMFPAPGTPGYAPYAAPPMAQPVAPAYAAMGYPSMQPPVMAPAMAAQPPQETMQQQLNRLATQVGRANTAMPRPPAAPRQPQAQPHAVPDMPVSASVDLSAITSELETLRRELGSLKDEVAKPVSVKTSVAQDEIDRIASAIAEFQRKDRIDPQQFDRLAAELDDLRTTMRQDLHDTMRRSLDAQARQEAETAQALSQKLDHIAHNVAAVQQAAHDASMGEDQIAGRIDELARQMEQLALHTATHSASKESEAARQADLTHRIEELAQQVASNSPDRVNDHVEDLSSRVERLTQQIEATTSGATAEIAERIEALRASMSQLPETIPTDRIEETLDTVSRKVEQLTEAAEASASAQHHLLKKAADQDTLSADDLAQIEARLDEIARAVVAVSNISRETQRIAVPEIDLSGMDRLEARLADLSRTVDTIASFASAEPERDPALDEIAVRIEGLTDRLGSFEKYARAGDLGGANAMLSAPDTGQIEEQLRVLTARVEEAAASNSTAAQMDNLEAQVAQIMVMLDQTPQAAAANIDLAPLEERLAGIENHLQQAPDLTVTAAQEAARQAISMVGESSEQGKLVAALSDHLNQLQHMAATGNAGTDQLQETLQAVMARLEAIENSVERANEQRVSVPYAPPPAMPAAVQLQETPYIDPAYHERQFAQQADQTFAAAGALMDVSEYDRQAPAPSAFVAAPSVDPADDLDGIHHAGPEDNFDDHLPLEPNGGTDAAGAFCDLQNTTSGSADVRPNAIAAARRALQATAADMNVEHHDHALAAPARPVPGAPAEGGSTLDGLKAKLAALASKANSQTLTSSEPSAGGGKDSKIDRLRKPIMIAAAAVLLALVAFQGSKMMSATSSDNNLAKLEMSVDQSGTASIGSGAVAPVKATEELQARDVAGNEAVNRPLAEMTDAADSTATASQAVNTPSPTSQRQNIRSVEQAADTRTAAAQTPATRERAGEQISSGSATRQGKVVEGTAGQATAPATPEVTYTVPENAGPVALVSAAQAGEPKALFEVGMRYSNGRGLTRDLAKAGTWFKASAERGFAPAQYSYGSLLEKGIGLEKDLLAASQWYEKAAAQGNARAMHNLAVLNASENPQTGQPDMERAIEWFQQAAAYGIKDSQFNLGILYGQGMGVPQNLEEAYKWFAIVARSGDTEAAAKRDQVAEAMDPAALNRVRATVENWQPKPINEAANRVAIPEEWKGRPGAATQDLVKTAQVLLNQRGFKVGTPDGLIGPKTTRAIMDFQKRSGIPVTGKVDARLLHALKV